MPSVGAVTSNLNATVKSGAYTAAANDLVLVDATTGPVTITVPGAPLVNTLIAVKKIDTTGNLVTVVPASGFIDSDTSVGLYSVGSTVTLQYDGSRWRLVSTGVTNIANPGSILPAGGTAGQILTKSSASSYDTAWAPAPVPVNDLPTGGAAGQVLTKNTGSNYDASWATAAAPAVAGALLPPWTVGGGRVFVAPPVLAGTATATPTGNAATYGIFVPVRIPTACTLVSVSVFPTLANTGATFYAGLYSDVPTATSGGPGVRLAGGSSLYSTVAFGPTTITLNYAVTAASTFWLCFGTTSTGYGLVSHAGATSPTDILLGGLNTFTLTAGSSPNVKYSASVDNTATKTDASTFTMTNGSSSIPVFAFTIA